MITKILKKYYPQLILVFVVFLVGITNFEPGKWITGWDNLQPEFNLFMNIKRSIFAVWQENQGLGLVGGLGHAAELPRQILLLLMSFFIPVNQLRFVFYMICLFFGALGMYSFLFRYVINDKKSALLGGLFYIFNLATIQTFYIQYESFVVQFAVLPWLFFTTTWILKERSRKAWFFFLLTSLLSIPQGFVPTLFIVTYGALGLYILSFFENKREYFVNVFRIIIVTFLLNAFWILPFAYFNLNSLHVVREAKINEMSSNDLYLKNLKASTFSNAIQLKGIWFDTNDFEKNSNLVPPIMGSWQEYTNQPSIKIINYSLFAIIIFGLITCFYKKERQLYFYIILFLTIFTILSNQQFPFTVPYKIIEKIPLYLEIFRIFFTKMAVLASFSYAILFAIGLHQITNRIKYLKLELATYLVVGGLLFFSIFPLFQGGLFYSNIRLNIPNEYFQLFDFFSYENPNDRIANFPQHTYVYWNYYNWGYRGSGFLWYGIEQPILDRAFDVWSPNNENYYWEISQAFNEKNPDLFDTVIHKYSINWLILDKSIIAPSNPKALQYDDIKSILSNSKKAFYFKSFGNIDVYKINNQNNKNFISIKSQLPYVAPIFDWSSRDQASKLYGDYISTDNSNIATVFFPFREINSNKNTLTPSYVTESNEQFVFATMIPESFSEKILKIPIIKFDDVTEFNPNDLTKTATLFPKIYLNGRLIYVTNDDNLKIEKEIQLPIFKNSGHLNVVVPKVKGYNSYDSNFDNSFFSKKAESCDTLLSGSFEKTRNNIDGIELSSSDASSCIVQDLPTLNHKSGYIISLSTEHIKGKSLRFQLLKLNNKELLLDNFLSNKLETEYILLTEQEAFNIGYRSIFNNVSIGNNPTINKITKFTINPIPYSFINSIRFEKNTISSSQKAVNYDVSHPNPSFYSVKIYDKSVSLVDNQYITLNQSYDDGWIAIQNGKLLPHFKINNWANGWKISYQSSQSKSVESVVIIFWPQYLQFLGFGLLIVSFLFILKFYPKDPQSVS